MIGQRALTESFPNCSVLRTGPRTELPEKQPSPKRRRRKRWRERRCAGDASPSVPGIVPSRRQPHTTQKNAWAVQLLKR